MVNDIVTNDIPNDGILIEDVVMINNETVHNVLLLNNDPVTEIINMVRNENNVLISTLRNNGIDIGSIDFEETIDGVITTENMYDESLHKTNDDILNESNIDVLINPDLDTNKTKNEDESIMSKMFRGNNETIIDGFVPRNLSDYETYLNNNDLLLNKTEKRQIIKEKFERENHMRFPRCFDETCRKSLILLPVLKEYVFMKSITGTFFDVNHKFIATDDFIPEFVEASVINFQTKLPHHEKNRDERIQLKYKDDSPTSLKIKSILKKHKVFDETKERVLDVSLLIGGTHIQDPHYDIARMHISFPDEILKEPEVNHEINRQIYNKAMLSPYAHSSVLIGFEDFKLAIPECYLNIHTEDNEVSIKFGNPNERFIIYDRRDYISYNHDGMVIKLIIIVVPKCGIQFVSDFIHSGANNMEGIPRQTVTSFKSFYKKVYNHVLEFNLKNTKTLINCLTKETILLNVTRLFFRTIPIDDCNLIAPLQNVGMHSINNCHYVHAISHKVNNEPSTTTDHAVETCNMQINENYNVNTDNNIEYEKVTLENSLNINNPDITECNILSNDNTNSSNVKRKVLKRNCKQIIDTTKITIRNTKKKLNIIPKQITNTSSKQITKYSPMKGNNFLQIKSDNKSKKDKTNSDLKLDNKRSNKKHNENKVIIPIPYMMLVGDNTKSSVELIDKQQFDISAFDDGIHRVIPDHVVEANRKKMRDDKRLYRSKKKTQQILSNINDKPYLFFKEYKKGIINNKALFAEPNSFEIYFGLKDYDTKTINLNCDVNNFKKQLDVLAKLIYTSISVCQQCMALEINHSHSFDKIAIAKIRVWYFNISFENWTKNLLLASLRQKQTMPLVRWYVFGQLHDNTPVFGCFTRREFIKHEIIALHWGSKLKDGEIPSTYAFKSSKYGTYDAKRGFYGNGKAVFNMGVHLMRESMITFNELNDLNYNEDNNKKLAATKDDGDDELSTSSDNPSEPNAILLPNFLLVALRNIEYGEEIIICYDTTLVTRPGGKHITNVVDFEDEKKEEENLIEEQMIIEIQPNQDEDNDVLNHEIEVKDVITTKQKHMDETKFL